MKRMIAGFTLFGMGFITFLFVFIAVRDYMLLNPRFTNINWVVVQEGFWHTVPRLGLGFIMFVSIIAIIVGLIIILVEAFKNTGEVKVDKESLHEDVLCESIEE